MQAEAFAKPSTHITEPFKAPTQPCVGIDMRSLMENNTNPWSWLDRPAISRFWSHVAGTGRYANEPQTNDWAGDLDAACAMIDRIRPVRIICYGCADGSRDPEVLLSHAKQADIPVASVVAIENTDQFKSEVERRIQPYGPDFLYILNP